MPFFNVVGFHNMPAFNPQQNHHPILIYLAQLIFIYTVVLPLYNLLPKLPLFLNANLTSWAGSLAFSLLLPMAIRRLRS